MDTKYQIAQTQKVYSLFYLLTMDKTHGDVYSIDKTHNLTQRHSKREQFF